MNEFRLKSKYAKEKLAGKLKEAAGKITGSEQLELKGKIQASRADFSRRTSMKNRIYAVKEGIAGKINDLLDKKRKRKAK